MAIVITLYNCGDANNKIVKSLGTGLVLDTDVIFKNEAELHAPEFTVKGSLSADYNYCSIEGVDERNRYYFVEVINQRTDISYVICRLDVLMTYGYEILNQIPVCCKRSALTGIQSEYVFDKRAPIEMRKDVSDDVNEQRLELVNPSSDMILITVG